MNASAACPLRLEAGFPNGPKMSVTILYEGRQASLPTARMVVEGSDLEER